MRCLKYLEASNEVKKAEAIFWSKPSSENDRRLWDHPSAGAWLKLHRAADTSILSIVITCLQEDSCPESVLVETGLDDFSLRPLDRVVFAKSAAIYTAVIDVPDGANVIKLNLMTSKSRLAIHGVYVNGEPAHLKAELAYKTSMEVMAAEPKSHASVDRFSALFRAFIQLLISR